MEEVDYIQKDKKNTFHGYNYASESAIKEKLHGALVKHGVLFFPTSMFVSRKEAYQTDKGKHSWITDVTIEYSFIDTESGEELKGICVGTGDDGADKGTYKAITGALKYALTSTFLIPTGDDPEVDEPKSEAKPPKVPKTAAEVKEQLPKTDYTFKASAPQIKEIYEIVKNKNLADTKEQIVPMINVSLNMNIKSLESLTRVEATDLIEKLKGI